MLGLRVGKWVTNAGGSRTIVALGVLVVLSLFHPTCGTLLSYHQLPLARPGAVQPQRLHQNDLWSPLWLRIRSYLCRRVPQSGAHPRWSVLFAAPVIALLYIFGTSAILAFVPSGQVNLIGPVPQALSVGLHAFGLANILAPVTILLLFGNVLSTANLTFSAESPAADGRGLGSLAAQMVHTASPEA